ncbi:unnamed protein product [Nezara viridula]|uniref:Uncharacterized protein n=1 Tax=Nezara viridula TaxID=85310 RepID=A0A9P0HRY9_NEZVI|nr:unnamed protein product [Nezara viridula]
MAHELWPWSSTSYSSGAVSAMASAKITTTILRIKLSLHLKSLAVCCSAVLGSADHISVPHHSHSAQASSTPTLPRPHPLPLFLGLIHSHSIQASSTSTLPRPHPLPLCPGLIHSHSAQASSTPTLSRPHPLPLYPGLIHSHSAQASSTPTLSRPHPLPLYPGLIHSNSAQASSTPTLSRPHPLPLYPGLIHSHSAQASSTPTLPRPHPLPLCPGLIHSHSIQASSTPTLSRPHPLPLCPGLIHSHSAQASSTPTLPRPHSLPLCPGLIHSHSAQASSTPTLPRPHSLPLCPGLIHSHSAQASSTPTLPRPHPLPLCPGLIHSHSAEASSTPTLPRPHPLPLCPGLIHSHSIQASSTPTLSRPHPLPLCPGLIHSHSAQASSTPTLPRPHSLPLCPGLIHSHSAQASSTPTLPRPHPLPLCPGLIHSHSAQASSTHSYNNGECSDERDWLAEAGLSEVTEPAFLSGREVPEAELTRALRLLSRQQAAAVRRRVDSLNKTVRQRARARQRGDIRQLFKDVESWSNDSRSRSATPDSLDSGPPTPPSPPRELYNPQPQSLQLNIDHPRLTPGAVNRHESRQRLVSPHTPFSSHHSLFRRASRSGADGIRMTGYQRIGSVRVRFGSDPINISNIGQDNQHPVVCVTRSDEGLFSDSSRRDSGDSAHSDTLGFEEMWAGERLCSSLNEMKRDWEEGTGRTWVDFLAEEDLNTLKPLVFLEFTALMDHSGLRVGKTKPPKRKRKEDGNIFGVSLSTLLERDRQIVQEPHNVPLVLSELERRCLWEEGLLRMGGNRTRCETLAAGLERDFYRRPEVADHLISTAAPHDLACINECSKALNLLVLLLPTEHRATLHALLTFLSNFIVGIMILACSILVDKAGLKAELGLAVHCCSLTELLITATDRLWLVPDNLVAQLRSINESHKENKPKPRLLARKGHVASRKAAGESEFESNIIHVDSPQFLVAPLPISLDKHITAAHVILRSKKIRAKREIMGRVPEQSKSPMGNTLRSQKRKSAPSS